MTKTTLGHPLDRLVVRPVVTAVLLIALASTAPAGACHATSPLVLDLGNDGLWTNGIFYPVTFDLNADGKAETIGWTHHASEDAFLWLDLNANHTVDDGSELFGTATRLATGKPASSGFEALAVYDAYDYGGDEDGEITAEDVIWTFLRLWIDRNHDGVSQREEIFALPRMGVVALQLSFVESKEVDGGGNLHRFHGTFTKRIEVLGEMFLRQQPMVDIFFKVAHDEEP